EERGLLGAGDRRPLDQPLGQLDVGLVRQDREIGVEEPVDLRVEGRRDARIPVAHVQAADATGPVEEGVAVDIGDRAALAPVDHHGGDERLRRCDDALLARDDRARFGPRDLGAQLDGPAHIKTPPRRKKRTTTLPATAGRLGGMVLSDRSIREEIAAGRIVIDPFDDALVQPSSVDVKVPMEDLTELVTVADDEPFILHPGEFVLGVVAERVRLPTDIVATLDGKSSLGRLGLVVHQTAGVIDAGFDCHITLELANVANLPITVYPGMRIAQLSFLTLTTPAEHPYGSGR